jgi:Zn-dependent alcohol dehydrogenase
MGSAVPRRDVPRLLGLHQAGLLPVDRLVTATITLDDINPAFDRLAVGEAVRQLVGFGREHA